MNREIHLPFEGLGAAFYPEQHPAEMIDQYIERLAECKVAFVRMAEFAWDKLEPSCGQYEFGWLDDVIAKLDKHNIKVVMCTPTAAPPVWLCIDDDDFFPLLASGKKHRFGARQHVCHNNEKYRQAAVAIADAMGRHYAQDPRIIAFQINNEIGAPLCYCPRCRKKFQDYCREEFGTIKNFNDRLGLHFWAQTYNDFSEICLPPDHNTPSMWQVYHQFVSKVYINSAKIEIDALHNAGVSVPITTNMMLTWYGYDHFEMAAALDYISGDYYFSSTAVGEDGEYANEVFQSAYLRGMKSGKNIAYHEFQCSRDHCKFSTPRPGETRMRLLSHFGLGADMITLFRFDNCESGVERDEYGLITSVDTPGRIFYEIRETISEIKSAAADWADSKALPAQAAFLYSYKAQYDIAHHPPCEDLDRPGSNGYPNFLFLNFRALLDNGINADIVFEQDDFSRYRVLFLTALYTLSDDLAARLSEFVRRGGKLVVFPLTGIVDEYSRQTGAFPRGLTDVCGVKVVDHGRYDSSYGKIILKSGDPSFPAEIPVDRWFDELQIQPGTEVLAEYSNRYLENIPAISRRRSGAGEAYYIGCWTGSKEKMKDLYRYLAGQLKLERAYPDLPPEVHASARVKGSRRFTFLSNYGNTDQTFEFAGQTVELKSLDVKIITETIQ